MLASEMIFILRDEYETDVASGAWITASCIASLISTVLRYLYKELNIDGEQS